MSHHCCCTNDSMEIYWDARLLHTTVLTLANLIITLNEANNQKEHFQQMILVLARSSLRCHGRCKHGSLVIVIDMA